MGTEMCYFYNFQIDLDALAERAAALTAAQSKGRRRADLLGRASANGGAR